MFHSWHIHFRAGLERGAARGGTISIIFIEPHSASLTSLWQSQSEKPDTRHIDFPSPAAKIYLGLRSGVSHNPSCLFATRICVCILCLFMASLVFLQFFLAKHLHIFGKNISHYMRHACGFQYVQYFHQKFHWIFTLDNFILVEFETTAAPGGRMFKISKWIILNF